MGSPQSGSTSQAHDVLNYGNRNIKEPGEAQRKSYQFSFPLPITSQHPPATATFYNYQGNVVTKSSPLMVEDQSKPITRAIKKSTTIPKADQERPHACTFKGCKWAFARLSDLRRHEKSHAAPIYSCPYYKNDPSCHKNGGAFNRLDVLKRHLKLVHYVRDKHQNFMDSDSGWCRSCQRMFPSSKTFIVHCLECAQSSSASTEWKIQNFQEKKDVESDEDANKEKEKSNIDSSLIDYYKLNESNYLESVAFKASNEPLSKRPRTT